MNNVQEQVEHGKEFIYTEKRKENFITAQYNRKADDIEKIYTICFFVYKNTIQDRYSLK